MKHPKYLHPANAEELPAFHREKRNNTGLFLDNSLAHSHDQRR